MLRFSVIVLRRCRLGVLPAGGGAHSVVESHFVGLEGFEETQIATYFDHESGPVILPLLTADNGEVVIPQGGILAQQLSFNLVEA